MRRYLASKKCIFCQSEDHVEEALVIIRSRSLVVSVCSSYCLSRLQESLKGFRQRRRFLASLPKLGREDY
jgi:hypothetical protein